MKTVNITTDSDIETRGTTGIVPSALPLNRLVEEIETAIEIHAVSADLRRIDREIFPTLISEMYHHGLTRIARLVLTITLRPLLMSEIQKLILSFFDSDSGLFALPPWRISRDDQLCAEILSRIAYDTISAYLAPLTKFYTFDRIDELLENTENAFCDALETINIDALF